MSRSHKAATNNIRMVFENNGLAMELFGSHQANLERIETALGVSIAARGNEVTLSGPKAAVNTAEIILESLYRRLKKGQDVGHNEVDTALRMASGGSQALSESHMEIKTQKRSIAPRSSAQAAFVKAIDTHALSFGIGPAGTGKTYLAVAKAVENLISGKVDRVILSRPAVEAGENLGFLPGDMRDKVDPYLRPLYDALYDMMESQQVMKRLASDEIEIAPLAFMRGRTLSNAFVILDEAQNTTAIQMKMLLTRLGENSRMVVTGDLTQVDLPQGVRSGLRDALEVLETVDDVAFCQFSDKDVVRHHLVTDIVRAYGEADSHRQTAARYEKRKNGAKDDDGS
jgi:phosphate starvation-inducible protein PhoH and related proteins